MENVFISQIEQLSIEHFLFLFSIARQWKPAAHSALRTPMAAEKRRLPYFLD